MRLSTRRSTRLALAVVVCSVPLLGLACGDDEGADRDEVVGAMADQVAVPMFEQFSDLALELQSSTTQLCAAPTQAAVVDARTVLADTRAAWRRSEAVWVGPVMDRRSWSVVDWPVAPDDIEALLADDTLGPLDAEFLATRIGAPLRGLGAIEYILYESGSDTATALADERRCQYLDGLAQVVSNEADAVLSLWTDGDQANGDAVPYRDEFAGTTDRMTATDSIDELVNSMLSRLEGSVNRELGKALGVGSGPADTSGIIEGPGAFGVADQQARAEGIRLVLLGPDGVSGLAPLLDSDLRTRLAAQFDTLDAALDTIDPPLVEATTADPTAVQAAHDAYAELRVAVATEVVSALGVTVSFSDADGDSAG
jgi:predicted lipoprotein